MTNHNVSALSTPPSIPFPPKKSVHEVLPGSGLKPLSRALLLLLDSYAWGDKDRCWPSVATLAQQLEVSERCVQKHLAELKARGLISEVLTSSNRTGRELVLVWKSQTFTPTVHPPVNATVHRGVNEKPPTVHPPVNAIGSPEFKYSKRRQEKQTTTPKTESDVVVVVPSHSFPDNQRLANPPDSQDEFDEETPDWFDNIDPASTPVVTRALGSSRLTHEVPREPYPLEPRDEDLEDTHECSWGFFDRLLEP